MRTKKHRALQSSQERGVHFAFLTARVRATVAEFYRLVNAQSPGVTNDDWVKAITSLKGGMSP